MTPIFSNHKADSASERTTEQGQRMDDCLALIGRHEPLFADDIAAWESQISHQVGGSSFLVIGGAGSIGGQARGLGKDRK